MHEKCISLDEGIVHVPEVQSGPLGGDVMVELLAIGQEQRLKRDQRLALKVVSSTQQFLVRSGVLLGAAMLDAKRRQLVGMCFPGDLLNEDCLLDLPDLVVRAISEVEVLVFDLGRLSPEAARDVTALVGQQRKRRIRDLLFHNLVVGRLTSEERVAAFLAWLGARSGREVGDLVAIEALPHRQDIADFLGLNPDTVSRIMANLRRSGLLRASIEGRHLLDVRGLASRAPAGTVPLLRN